MFLLVASAAVALTCGMLRAYRDWVPTILGWLVIVAMVALVGKGLYSRMTASSAESVRSNDADKATSIPDAPAAEQHKGQRQYPKTAETLRSEAARALDTAAHEQERLAQALGKYRCFYKHCDETVGPVTLWNVRELVETELLTPDAPVILEGSDYWFTYAQQELRIAPPPGADRAKLEMAGKFSCIYRDAGHERGPLSLLAIFHLIRAGRLSADVQIRADGTDEWKRAYEI